MALLNTIDNFTGAYRREGLNIVKLQGKQYLTGGFRTAEHRSSQNDAHLSNLGIVKDFDSISFSDDVSIEDQLIGIDADGNIIMIYDDFVASRDVGIIHNITVSSSSNIWRISTNPGIITTTNNNIFYTHASYIGCGYFFRVSTATATSITVSDETFNTTYGINDDDWNSKIYNITKKEAYTNTIATPTDTLGFTTATTTPENGDYIFVFNDKAFAFNTTALTDGEHFASQSAPAYWARPIKLSNNHYYILNGNYIARIDVSDNDATNSTMDETWQRLYRGRQALCFDMNRENILVGTEFRGSYELFLYNEYSFGALNSIILPDKPNSIIAYESGWLIMAGGVLYYSNGYQLKKISTIPDFEDSDTRLTMAVKGMNYKNDNVFILADDLSDRYGRGLFIYNFKYGWSFTSLADDDTESRANIGTGGIIKFKKTIYAGYQINNGSGNNVIGEIFESTSGKKRLGLLFHFDEHTSITQIGLTLSEIYDQITGNTRTTDVTVSYANTRRPLHLTEFDIGENSSSTVINFPNGAYYKSKIGQKLLFTSGNVAGETTYITDIGSNGAALTVSPALSVAPSDYSKITKYNLYKAGTKTIDVNNIPQDIRFSTNFVGDIMYLEIELENGYLDISNIKLYG